MLRNVVPSVLALTVVACSTLAQSPEERQYELRHIEWAEAHVDEIIDELFPLSRVGAIVYRYVAGFHRAPEEFFRIERSVETARLTAVVRRSDGDSLYMQLLSLREKMPDGDINEIKKHLRVTSLTVTEEGCPQLRLQVEKLEGLTVSLPVPAIDGDTLEIFLHPDVHTLTMNNDHTELILHAFMPKNRLIEWALRTKQVLQSCTTGQQSKLTTPAEN